LPFCGFSRIEKYATILPQERKFCNGFAKKNEKTLPAAGTISKKKYFV